MLRNKRLGGYKFRRQVPLGPYTVDFYCPQAKLVVELDGTSHDGQGKQDEKRDAHLGEMGLEVIRVTNSDLATVPDSVKQVIYDAVTRRIKTDPPPSPLPKREGEPEDAETTPHPHPESQP